MNENGEGPLGYIAVLGGLVLLAIAGTSFAAPLVQARLLEAQAARDIARANATMAQGLADVARINAVAAMTPMLLACLVVIALCIAGMAALVWARIAWRHLQLRERAQRLTQPAPRRSVPTATTPQVRETWTPVVLTMREWAQLEGHKDAEAQR